MRDFCGQLGSVYTNPIVALPLGAVSTFRPPAYLYHEGEKYFDPGVMGIPGTVKPLDLADLACPTFGVGKSTAPDGTVETTFGAPYLPIIVPPKQLTTLDSLWQKSCTEILSVGEFLKSFAIVDPPRILQPAAALGPASPADVPAMETPAPHSVMAQPNASPVPNTGETLPTATTAPNSNPGSNPKDSDPVDPRLSPNSNVSNPDAKQPGRGPLSNPANPNTTPESNPPSKPQVTDEPFTDPKALDAQEQGFSADPAQPNDPQALQSRGPNLGGLILSALNGGKSDSTAGGNANTGQVGDGHNDGTRQNNQRNPPPQDPPLQNPKIFSIADKAFTATDPSKVALPAFSKTLLPGEATIIANTPISFGSLGTLFVDNTPIPLPQTGPGQGMVTFAPVNTPRVFVAAGLPFTPLPSSQGVAIYGKTIVPGALPVMFLGTPVSLDSSGGLQIGSSVFAVPTPAALEVGVGIFSAAGFAFTPLPFSEGLAINGLTLVPGGLSATVSGKRISVDLTGGLHMGPSLIPLPTPAPGSARGLFTAGGLTFTSLSSANGVAIDGQTLVPGGSSATVSGTRISLDSTGGLHVGSSLISLPTPVHGSAGAVYTAGGLKFTSLSSGNGVAIDGQTLVPGGLPVTNSGARISLDSTGVLHVGSSLIALATPAPDSGTGVFTADGLKFTSLPSSQGVAIDGQTVAPGGPPVTVLGTRISLDSTGGLIVGPSLIALPTLAPGSGPEIFSASGFTVTRLPSRGVVISGTTILPGGAPPTISGTPVRLDQSGTVFLGTTSVFLSSSPTVSNSSVVVPFLGGQAKGIEGPRALTWLVGAIGGILLLLFCWV